MPKTLLEVFSPKPQPYTIRFPAEMFQQLKNDHAETFAEHRLSFNAWLLRRIQLSFMTGV